MVKNKIHTVVLIFSLGLFIQINFNYVNSLSDNYFRYCKNGHVENQTYDTCQNGVNFGLGEDQQNCICVKGVYKMYTDACQEGDGFASEEICTTLRDEEANSNSWSMHLAVISPDFSWTSTSIACNKAPGAIWSVTAGNESVATKDDSFYIINGKPYSMPDSTFCVQKERHRNAQICRYFKNENPSWRNASQYSISIQNSCRGGTPLNTHVCFPTLTSRDSECSIQCPYKRPKESGEDVDISVPPTSSENGTDPDATTDSPGATIKPPGATTKPPKPGTGEGGSGSQGLRPTRKPIKLTKEDFDKNCTDPDDYRNHDNRYLNRKMLLYNVVNQLDMRSDADKSILETMEPNRTLPLFDLMKTITKSLCPTKFVNSQWIDQVVDLFYILHKGNVFRYEEILKPEQFQWIKDILTLCQTNVIPIVLSYNGFGEECSGAASGLASGYCTSYDEADCQFVPVTVDLEGEDSYKRKHYVPEVAWNIVDAIHVACFPQFNESYRMFHVLEQAVERLFTLQIKNLWHHPGWLEKTKTKLLGFGADNNMYNLDVCLQAAYGVRNGDVPRLVRPYSPVYLRKKRAASKRGTKKDYIRKPPHHKHADSRSNATVSRTTRPTRRPRPSQPDHAVGCVARPSDLRRPEKCQWAEL